MRFKTELRNIRTFSKIIAALSSLEKITWVRLDNEIARFTVIPDTGSQVWASLAMDLIFDDFLIQSAEANNTINLELPLQPLQRALKSALNSVSASLRLTKKDGLPILSMMITTTTASGSSKSGPDSGHGVITSAADDPDNLFLTEAGDDFYETSLRQERQKIITQDIPVRILHPDTVETIMQPNARPADVHIILPPLLQLKAISDRFTRLAMASSLASSGGGGAGGGAGNSAFPSSAGGGIASTAAGGLSSLSSATSPRLELSANMHGGLRLRAESDGCSVQSEWTNLDNPKLDPYHMDVPLADHPTTRFLADGPSRWATVRVDGRDWSKVLSVGRLEGRVIACFTDDHALVLYVYVPQYDGARGDESVITYYVQSYSA